MVKSGIGADPELPSKKYKHDPYQDPQLQWSGKYENSEFDVDAVSLYIHEQIDPSTIIEKVTKLEKQSEITAFFESDANNLPYTKAIEFYKHEQNWSNRLVAGDSLLVMNSLLTKESMGGKVQMIYFDPPYGINFNSNAPSDMQEIEPIKAFRDTWELGIHSYLSYLRNRLLLAKELLTESGSCIIQISIKNVALVRNVMDEIFGSKNFVNMITMQKTTSSTSVLLDSVADYLVWYTKNIDEFKQKYHEIYIKKDPSKNSDHYKYVELKNGTRRTMTKSERKDPSTIPIHSKMFYYDNLTSKRIETGNVEFKFNDEIFTPNNASWKTSLDGLSILADKNRIEKIGNSLMYVRYFDDFQYVKINNVWTDVLSSFAKKIYVVQTIPKIIERIMLMTTDPGDLVFDPTCGSGTTAFVAEKLGRRWITCDTSRISIRTAERRLMTSVFDYYELADSENGINSGFKYEETDRITLSSVARNEFPSKVILYDNPIVDENKTRIAGPFTCEAVSPQTTQSIDELYQNKGKSLSSDVGISDQQLWRDEISKTGIRSPGGRINFSSINPDPETKWIHATGMTKANDPQLAVISFGPKYAPLGLKHVELTLQEVAELDPPPHMVIFAAMQFDPEASRFIDTRQSKNKGKIRYLKAEINKDILTGDLKKARSTNDSFWEVGQPDVKLKKTNGKYIVKVQGYDYYDIKTGKIKSGDDKKIAMWMLDEDYDGRSIYPQQIFFVNGNESDLKKLGKHLHAHIDDDLFEQYMGTTSIPFELGKYEQVAVKIIGYDGVESMRVFRIKDGKVIE